MSHTSRRLRDVILRVTVLDPQQRDSLYQSSDIEHACGEVRQFFATRTGARHEAENFCLGTLYQILIELQEVCSLCVSVFVCA